ncbi:NAD-dependent epimerase/dehydratase family protein [Stratiformator vulcanicus]|uniref:UDP-glucose 4-epimerase n=1 Tax=Stratiformator vulcanicus TaxID=2527980 RepID=A0A517R1A6_9PLAN|nr:NAD-dependent epimerase/dehydratase family protein [Stratiformator vulcanicus]QDT37633.1 UDP-glucose 4-epimerase [Stratiformator vulcanicus]
MRVLVTGGAGFIGSHILEQLASAGVEAAALDDLSGGKRENVPEGVPLFEVDVRDASAVKTAFDEFRPTHVSHQAAQVSVSRSVREPEFDAEVNVLGLLNVIRCCGESEVERLLFASSGGAIYGDVLSPAKEDHPTQPLAPYGISKMVGEHYLRFAHAEHGLIAVALRYSNVYGPRQDPHGEAGVVAIFSQKMLSGEEVTIFGDGKYVRDYVHVGDVAAANVAALDAELEAGKHAFNIGTAVPTDVNQLAALVMTAATEATAEAGKPVEIPKPVHGDPRAGDLRSSIISSAKAKAELGWEPQHSIESGLAETVRWFLRRG